MKERDNFNKATNIAIIVAVTFFVAFLLGVHLCKAQEDTMTASVRWSNCNVLTTPHPKPLDFTVTDTGYTANMADGSVAVYTWINDILLLEWEDAWAVIDEDGFTWGDCIIS